VEGTDEFQRVIDQLEPLLERLTASPRAPLAEHPSIPKAPGIYLFSEGPNPIYVGQTRDLQQRLRQHTSPSSRENSAPLAFNIALGEARQDQSIDTSGTRKEIAARRAFDALFGAARERVAQMSVQVIELDDPVTRTIFEVYAARVLQTGRLGAFTGALRGDSQTRPW
jgi:GIY-YIG catalytic domain